MRLDYIGLVHIELHVPGRQHPNQWAPLCDPNGDRVETVGCLITDSGPTCLWCITERRRQ